MIKTASQVDCYTLSGFERIQLRLPRAIMVMHVVWSRLCMAGSQKFDVQVEVEGSYPAKS